MDERTHSRYAWDMRRSLLFWPIASLALACTSGVEPSEPSPARPPDGSPLPSARAPEDLPIRPMAGNRVASFQRAGSSFVADFESPGDWVGTAAHYEAKPLGRDLELERSEAEVDTLRTLVLEGRRPTDGLEARISLRQEGSGPIQVHFKWIPAHVED